jgi:hypothetical protein
MRPCHKLVELDGGEFILRHESNTKQTYEIHCQTVGNHLSGRPCADGLQPKWFGQLSGFLSHEFERRHDRHQHPGNQQPAGRDYEYAGRDQSIGRVFNLYFGECARPGRRSAPAARPLKIGKTTGRKSVAAAADGPTPFFGTRPH